MHSYEQKQTAALEAIAEGVRGLVRQGHANQHLLATIARHLIGGMSPDEVLALQAEARELMQGLQSSREQLTAAIRSQSKP